MKITILGSGGGEGYPATFCGCDNCVNARRLGGKNIRTLPQTMINDDLLIDYPSDSAYHALAGGYNFGDIPNILITHTHCDHLNPIPFGLRGAHYAHNLKSPELNIYGSLPVKDMFDSIIPVAYANSKFVSKILETIHINEIKAYETKIIGKYEVTALPAKHAPHLVSLNYVIREGEKTLLYFHDTGYPTPEVTEFVKKEIGRVDCVIMDATLGTMDAADTEGHMSFAQDRRLMSRLISEGIADDKSVFVINHITHNHAPSHEEIEKIFADTEILVSYDGMTLEI